MRQDISPKKYILVFFITLAIFAIIFALSNYFYNQRLQQVKTAEDDIRNSILESDIQYALLADSLCDADNNERGGANLINDLNSLTNRLTYMEDQRGINDPDVIALKKDYTLLQIKDYLLLRERTKRCGEHPLSILYFYSNRGNCADCKKMGYVLTAMREDYNNLHVYSFDYNIDLSVMETLKSLYNIEGRLPVLVIDRRAYYGFKTRPEIESLVTGLTKPQASSTKKS